MVSPKKMPGICARAKLFSKFFYVAAICGQITTGTQRLYRYLMAAPRVCQGGREFPLCDTPWCRIMPVEPRPSLLLSCVSMSSSRKTRLTRREFVADATKAAAALAIAPTIVPRHVLGRGYQAPSDTLNVASVGIGGMGMNNMNTLAKGGERIVAI